MHLVDKYRGVPSDGGLVEYVVNGVYSASMVELKGLQQSTKKEINMLRGFGEPSEVREAYFINEGDDEHMVDAASVDLILAIEDAEKFELK